MKDQEESKSELVDLIPPQSKENIAKVKGILSSIIADGIKYEIDVVKPLSLLLDSEEIELNCLAAQSIAELCKCEKKRISYAQNDIVKRILHNLDAQITAENAELVKQSCRALGNICYDSYVGRDLVLNLSGIPIVVNILPKTLKCDESLKEDCYNVRLFTCKLLLILMLGGSEYIKPALDVDFVQNIYQVIHREFHPTEELDCLETALLITSVVAEYSRTLVIDEKLTLLIVEILKSLTYFETIEACLEYLHYQAEHDEVKVVLAKAAVPQILWNLLKRYREVPTDEDVSELRKLACDLIALILTGDASMNLLYSDGKGEFYLSMINSLHSEDVELSITAILAVGNFARTDTHCMHMMDTGVFAKLMSILVLHKSQEDDIRLQHVVLSGLRNLVIPQRNKALAIEKGILPLLIEMIPNVTQYHVVFKLLATLRMLVDGQEMVAKDLVSSNMLDKVAKWGIQSEHNGVSGEASRLLARIVRQLQMQNFIIKVVEVDNSVACLVNMLAVTHAIMQNEAIVALTVLCANCFTKKCKDSTEEQGNETENRLVDELIKADVAKQLNFMLERNANKIQPEIAENLSKFMSLTVKHQIIKDQMCQNKTHDYLEKLIAGNESLNDNLKNLLKNLVTEIGQTN